ncbi:sensor histidine kinase [Bacillus sp. 1P06AnD]|uniref:sensor histidine kinase n=1 Tax=Bacillus sp. 1P06AnD TaxID=3132208 RepID=UPI00399F0447
MGYQKSDLDQYMSLYYENSRQALIFLKGDGDVIGMNRAAERLLDGQTLSLVKNHNAPGICLFCRGFTSEKETVTCAGCFLEQPEQDFSSFQLYLKGKEDDRLVPYSASFQKIDGDKGIYALTLQDLTLQYKTRESLYRSKMMSYVIKAQEDERKRISRELHDSVAQELLSSLVDMRVMKYMNLNEEALQKLKHTEETITRLLEEIRNLSVELRPASLDDLGLEAAFRSHFKWVEMNYGIIVHFTAELSSARYSTEIETVVYRICQEAILNAIKYAESDELFVRLYEEKGNLVLYVKDKGVGFNVQYREIKGTGLGLYGMMERAQLVDGELDIQSQIGKGTAITLRIPMDKERLIEEDSN